MPDDEPTLTAANPDTGVAQSSEPAQPAAPATSATPESDTAQGALPATAAPVKPTGDAGSLTPPNTQTNSPPVDWQKRYSDLQSHTDRQIQEWKTRQQQQGLEMSQLQRFKQEQEQRAKAASLKRFHKDHPEHAKFQSVVQRRDMAQRQMATLQQRSDLSPEQKNALAEVIRSPLSNEELQEVNEYEEYTRNFQRELASDPRSAIAPIVRDEFKALFQEEMGRMRAQSDVARDFNDPEFKPLVEAHREDIAKALQDGVPYEYTIHMAKMFAEVEKLRGELKVATGKSVQADERTRLLKGEASISRDPRAPAPDPYVLAKKEAAEKGISTGSPAFARILSKHTIKG